MIRRGSSIFASRTGKQDIFINKETDQDWGLMYDGKHYQVAMILDPDDFHPFSSYLTVPDEILSNLKEWGF
jgi:hypothetical protein